MQLIYSGREKDEYFYKTSGFCNRKFLNLTFQLYEPNELDQIGAFHRALNKKRVNIRCTLDPNKKQSSVSLSTPAELHNHL